MSLKRNQDSANRVLHLIATDPKYKHAVMGGMLLAHGIHKNKKKYGSGSISFKKVLAGLAGPVGWIYLAKTAHDEKLQEQKKKRILEHNANRRMAAEAEKREKERKEKEKKEKEKIEKNPPAVSN